MCFYVWGAGRSCSSRAAVSRGSHSRARSSMKGCCFSRSKPRIGSNFSRRWQVDGDGLARCPQQIPATTRTWRAGGGNLPVVFEADCGPRWRLASAAGGPRKRKLRRPALSPRSAAHSRRSAGNSSVSFQKQRPRLRCAPRLTCSQSRKFQKTCRVHKPMVCDTVHPARRNAPETTGRTSEATRSALWHSHATCTAGPPAESHTAGAQGARDSAVFSALAPGSLPAIRARVAPYQSIPPPSVP